MKGLDYTRISSWPFLPRKGLKEWWCQTNIKGKKQEPLAGSCPINAAEFAVTLCLHQKELIITDRFVGKINSLSEIHIRMLSNLLNLQNLIKRTESDYARNIGMNIFPGILSCIFLVALVMDNWRMYCQADNEILGQNSYSSTNRKVNLISAKTCFIKFELQFEKIFEILKFDLITSIIIKLSMILSLISSLNTYLCSYITMLRKIIKLVRFMNSFLNLFGLLQLSIF